MTGMSPFYTLYNFHLTIKLHVKDNVLKGEVPAIANKVKTIQDKREALNKRWQVIVNI
jgi:hypothetical protein